MIELAEERGDGPSHIFDILKAFHLSDDEAFEGQEFIVLIQHLVDSY